MTTIYTRLATLGFAEWLKANDNIYYALLKYFDESDINSHGRTELNALAFRWLREEKNLHFYVRRCFIPHKEEYVAAMLVSFDNRRFDALSQHSSYELASIACLEKAEEILNKEEM